MSRDHRTPVSELRVHSILGWRRWGGIYTGDGEISEETSEDVERPLTGSNRVSNDGRLTIVQCHHYHRPPSSDLYWSSVGILPYSDTTNQTCILIIVITNQHHILSTTAQPQPHHAPHMFHVPGQSHRTCTSLEVMSRGHHKDLRGFTLASFSTIRNTSLLVICSFY